MILTYNNKIVMSGNKMVTYQLPDNTLLFKFGAAGYDPSSLTTLTGATWTRVSAEPNIWLWDARGVETTDWSEAFRGKFSSYDSSGYVNIIGAGELTIPVIIGTQIVTQIGSDYPGMFRNNGNTLQSVCYLSFPNAELARCLFQNNSNLLRIEGLNLPKVTTFQSMFKNCTNLESIGSITSSPNLTNCQELFQYCQQLKTFPWFETSNVTNISSMFTNCRALQTIPLIDTSKITTMSALFGSYCTSLKTVPLLNTSNVTTMQGMFNGCTSLTSVPQFNTSKVTNMSTMFCGCTSLTTVPLFNASNVTTMSGMFSNCDSITTVPLFDTSNVTTMTNMFFGCDSLTTVPLFDTSKVTDMGGAFSSCVSLQSIPLFDTSKVTNFYSSQRGGCFYNCSSLTNIPLLNTDSATNVTQMFRNCRNIESGTLAIYNQMINQTTPPRTHSATFENCGADTTTGAAELAQIPTSWGGTMA